MIWIISLHFIVAKFMLLILMISLIQEIKISEIMYNPAGLESSNEFVEVYNMGTEAVDLTGFSISDSKGFDKLILVSGSIFIEANQYALILDASYFGNSTDYDQLIPADIPVFKTTDSTIGSAGLSNSSPETVLLLNSLDQIVDSITYQANYPNGFSFERQFEFGSAWGQSINENGTPGFQNSIDRYIERIELNSLFDRKNNEFEIHIVNRDHQFRSELIESNLSVYKYNLSGQFELIMADINHFSLDLNSNDSIDHSIPVQITSNGQFLINLNLTNQASINLTDTIEFVYLEDRFPILINLVKLERPQLLRFYNHNEFPFFMSTIDLKGTGTWKTIPVNRQLNPNEFVIISKYTDDYGAIFNEDIPFLSSVNGSLSIRIEGEIDSITFKTDQIPFYNDENGLIPRFTTDYNSEIAWIANPFKNRFEIKKDRHFEIKLVNNPFSPNDDGIADHLKIELNYSDFDLIQLKVFSLTGRLIREIAQPTYVGIGNYSWDGRDNTGRLQITGPYILYFSGKLNSSGETLTRKIPIVLVR